ncbi:MAG TPA: hypothetical protein VNO24_29435 [Blastocatellia bacterium]|nr:hypothetical protein [Blastocatellia bacterium]
MTNQKPEKMTNQKPERIVDEYPSGEKSDRAALTTADMAAAGTAPTKAKAAPEGEPGNPQGSMSNPQGSISSQEGFEPLFDQGEADDFRSRWYGIQSGFVDQPRRSVEEADELVAAVMKRLAEVFAGERENLEQEWGSGDDVSTEDLRVALRRYRSFFDRLLSV